METTVVMINDEKWAVCPECGHKIFKIEKISGEITFESKCHSCKTVSKITIGGCDGKEV